MGASFVRCNYIIQLSARRQHRLGRSRAAAARGQQGQNRAQGCAGHRLKGCVLKASRAPDVRICCGRTVKAALADEKIEKTILQTLISRFVSTASKAAKISHLIMPGQCALQLLGRTQKLIAQLAACGAAQQTHLGANLHYYAAIYTCANRSILSTP